MKLEEIYNAIKDENDLNLFFKSNPDLISDLLNAAAQDDNKSEVQVGEILKLLIKKGFNESSFPEESDFLLSNALYLLLKDICLLLVEEGFKLDKKGLDEMPYFFHLADSYQEIDLQKLDEILQMLDNLGLNLDARDSDGNNIIKYLFKKHYEKAEYADNKEKELIEQFISVFIKQKKINKVEVDDQGNNAIHISADYFVTKGLIELLEKQGCDKNQLNNNKMTPLMIVARTFEEAEYALMVDMGMSVKEKGDKGKSVIHFILTESPDMKANGSEWEEDYKLNMLKKTLEVDGVDPNIQDEDGNTYVMSYVEDMIGSCDFDYRMVWAGIEKGLDLNHKNKQGETFIYKLLGSGFEHEFSEDMDTEEGEQLGTFSQLRKLVEKGKIDLKLGEEEGKSCLFAAITAGESINLVKYLIEAGLNVGIKNEIGENLLYQLLTYFKNNDKINANSTTVKEYFKYFWECYPQLFKDKDREYKNIVEYLYYIISSVNDQSKSRFLEEVLEFIFDLQKNYITKEEILNFYRIAFQPVHIDSSNKNNKVQLSISYPLLPFLIKKFPIDGQEVKLFISNLSNLGLVLVFINYLILEKNLSIDIITSFYNFLHKVLDESNYEESKIVLLKKVISHYKQSNKLTLIFDSYGKYKYHLSDENLIKIIFSEQSVIFNVINDFVSNLDISPLKSSEKLDSQRLKDFCQKAISVIESKKELNLMMFVELICKEKNENSKAIFEYLIKTAISDQLYHPQLMINFSTICLNYKRKDIYELYSEYANQLRVKELFETLHSIDEQATKPNNDFKLKIFDFLCGFEDLKLLEYFFEYKVFNKEKLYAFSTVTLKGKQEIVAAYTVIGYLIKKSANINVINFVLTREDCPKDNFKLVYTKEQLEFIEQKTNPSKSILDVYANEEKGIFFSFILSKVYDNRKIFSQKDIEIIESWINNFMLYNYKTFAVLVAQQIFYSLNSICGVIAKYSKMSIKSKGPNEPFTIRKLGSDILGVILSNLISGYYGYPIEVFLEKGDNTYSIHDKKIFIIGSVLKHHLQKLESKGRVKVEHNAVAEIYSILGGELKEPEKLEEQRKAKFDQAKSLYRDAILKFCETPTKEKQGKNDNTKDMEVEDIKSPKKHPFTEGRVEKLRNKRQKTSKTQAQLH